MTDRPIIFSGPMVLGLLREINHRGTGKIMTRRLEGSPLSKAVPGDRLWVRESAHITLCRKIGGATEVTLKYDADGAETWWVAFPERLQFAPLVGRALPNAAYREASRITLVVTAKKFEPVQNISKEDVIAEGLTEWEGQPISGMVAGWHQPYAALWQKLHGARTWEKNPRVVALTFIPHLFNVDNLPGDT